MKIGNTSHFEPMDNLWKLNFLNFALTSHWTEVSSHCRSVGSTIWADFAFFFFRFCRFCSLFCSLALSSSKSSSQISSKLEIPCFLSMAIWKYLNSYLTKETKLWTHYSISHYRTGNSLIFWLNFCGFCGYLLLTNKYPQWILKQSLYLLYIEANLLNNIPMILNDAQVYPSWVLKIKSTYSIYPFLYIKFPQKYNVTFHLYLSNFSILALFFRNNAFIT